MTVTAKAKNVQPTNDEPSSEPRAGLKPVDLAADIALGIANGRYPVGSILPTEYELCDLYQTSRYAVRQALSELQEQGLISRKKNVGSTVESARPTAGFVQALSSVEDLARFGATNVRAIQDIREIVVDLELAKDLGCPGGTRMVHVSSLRYESGTRKRPMAVLDIYLDPAYKKIAEAARDTPNTLISTLIEQKFGRRIAKIQQIVDATAVPEDLAEGLKVAPGSPALKIVRRYLDAANIAFEVSVSIYPAGRLTMSTELRRAATPKG